MNARAIVTIVGLWIAACGGPVSSAQTELSAAKDNEITAENLKASNATPEQGLALKAKKYAQGLVADGPVIHGSLAESARSDHLLVLRGGNCYRILGVGSAEVEDLDLFLYDPNGVQTQQDPGQDRFPILGLQPEICPPASAAYRLQALMYKGSGTYALRVYRTP